MGSPIGTTLETDVTLCSGMNRRSLHLPERERYPTGIGKEMHGLPTSCSDVRQRRTAGWPTAGDRQGHGVPIVVVGVTSHQGGQECWPQGKGAQVVTRDTPSRYAQCGSPKGRYLSPSLKGCDHWKAQCGDTSHAAFGEGPTEKGCSRSTSLAAYSTWGGAEGKGLLTQYLASGLLHHPSRSPRTVRHGS